VQIPAWDRRVIDLDQAAASRGYCDDFRGRLSELGLEITELAGYLQGQVLAVHPAYAPALPPFTRPDWMGRRAPNGQPGSCKSACVPPPTWGCATSRCCREALPGLLRGHRPSWRQDSPAGL